MKKKIPYHSCENEKGQTLEIYSFFGENFYRVAGYHSDGRVLFDGISPCYTIEYWEVGRVVKQFTGESMLRPKRPKKIMTESQESLKIDPVPCHSPLVDKWNERDRLKKVGQAELNKKCEQLLKIVS